MIDKIIERLEELRQSVNSRWIVDRAIQIVKEESENNGWIKCSDRLPDDRSEVLVTAYWHETYQVMMASYFGDGLWWCVPFNNCGEHMQKLDPKVWMPLPEPYREENVDDGQNEE